MGKWLMVGRYLAVLPFVGTGALAAGGCVVDATDEGSGETNKGALITIPPLADEDRFPAPQQMGETDKACWVHPHMVDITWLAWGPFPNSGNFGWVSCEQYCPVDSFAYSLQLKTEPSQGGGDDTAMNGIAMDCYHKYPDVNGNVIYTGTITSQVGPWGNWGTRALCPTLGWPIVSGKVTDLEQAIQGDDTALNKITANCRDGTLLQPSANTTFGGPVGQDMPCQEGTAVCGIKTQLEPNQGGGDDTALNGGVFYCCTL